MNRALIAVGVLLILCAQGGHAQTINGDAGVSVWIDPEGITAPDSNSAKTDLPRPDSQSAATPERLDGEAKGVPTQQETVLVGIKPSDPDPNPEATSPASIPPGQPLQVNGFGSLPTDLQIPEAIALADLNLLGETRLRLRQFATKHARYVSVSWAEIPDWHNGVTVTAWNAFVQSCTDLIRRPAWREACEAALVRPIRTAASARAYFEREFEAFQIRTLSSADTGLLTGYYEPLLNGSRVRTPRFRYPVYGVPDDLLFLDARLLGARRQGLYVRIEGRDVLPVNEDSMSSRRSRDTKVYRLAVARAPAILRDGRIRVRVSGDRIVPYFTRWEIERRGLNAAQPIAWVDDADVLYALHVEGSGRIRLSSGQVLRVAFAEQNGHAFRASVVVRPAQQPAQKRRSDAVASTLATVPQDSAPLQQGIDAHYPATAGSEMRTSPKPREAIGDGLSRPSHALREEGRPRVVASSRLDPSYVFFRQAPHTESGPLGTMSIPLTPDASLAVDPRVTPLGAPVFIAARPSGSTDTTKRLMVAQDTGGAIRGALRADYFLGFGPAATTAAMRMKDELRMWVLLPKRLAVAAGHTEPASAACLLVDPDFCAE
ncbi:MAG TPA: MltA domain-containing protein [Burkholderiales bacterium]|nr:MltA domain-containing protein [Burkholderiales bacterium]